MSQEDSESVADKIERIARDAANEIWHMRRNQFDTPGAMKRAIKAEILKGILLATETKLLPEPEPAIDDGYPFG